jgi:hypothetical protein
MAKKKSAEGEQKPAGAECRDCAHRNNKVSDKGPTGSGFCSMHKKFTSRRQEADKCAEFRRREKQKNVVKRNRPVEEDQVKETASVKADESGDAARSEG